jgi:hypothetical protein
MYSWSAGNKDPARLQKVYTLPPSPLSRVVQTLLTPSPFESLSVPSDSQGLSVPSDSQGLSVPSDAEGLSVPSDAEGLSVPSDSEGRASARPKQNLLEVGISR